MDAVPIVPPLFWAPKTRHFTSYKHTTDHELLTRQNSLSCAPCCAALSLRIIPISESAAVETAGKGIADDRHLAELSPTRGVYRGSGPDRCGPLDRAVPRRFPAARSGKAFCL